NCVPLSLAAASPRLLQAHRGRVVLEAVTTGATGGAAALGEPLSRLDPGRRPWPRGRSMVGGGGGVGRGKPPTAVGRIPDTGRGIDRAQVRTAEVCRPATRASRTRRPCDRR